MLNYEEETLMYRPSIFTHEGQSMVSLKLPLKHRTTTLQRTSAVYLAPSRCLMTALSTKKVTTKKMAVATCLKTTLSAA